MGQMIGWKHVITLCPEGADRFFGFVLLDYSLTSLLARVCVCVCFGDSKISWSPQRDGQLKEQILLTTYTNGSPLFFVQGGIRLGLFVCGLFKKYWMVVRPDRVDRSLPAHFPGAVQSQYP